MVAEHRTDTAVEALLGVPVPPRPDDTRDPPMAVRLPPGKRGEVKAKAKERGLTPNALAVRGILRELDDPAPTPPPKEETTDGRTP